MATVFKPTRTYPLQPNPEIIEKDGRPHVRMKDKGKVVTYPMTKDGAKYLKPGKRWYVEYRDGNGIVQRAKGFTDKKATEGLASELERKAERARVGYHDPAEEHARRTLANHLKDYAAALDGKGNTADHTRQTVARVAALFSGCGFVFPPDVTVGKAVEWLNALRRPGLDTVTIPPGQTEFTPAAVASLLGISGAAVRAAVKLHKLPATGQGKARRFPRATVEALVGRMTRGRGPETVNHYVRAVRGFLRWMVRVNRIGSNPLDSLTLLNARVDIRRSRRELTADELRELLTAARDSARAYRGLTGPDRFHLYLTAAGTGFRARALSNLTPDDFDLVGDSPTVTLAARFNKSRKPKVQPLPPDVAEQLRVYLAGRPGDQPVWGGTWAKDKRGAEMIRGDLETAGIPYSVEGPDGPEYADFHALRHSYLTLGGRSGIDLRTLQELAGHSKPELTARYSHRRIYDLTGAVGKFPNFLPPDAGSEVVEQRATGTDGPILCAGAHRIPVEGSAQKTGLESPIRTGSDVVPDVVPDVGTGGADRQRSAPKSTFRLVGGSAGELTQTQRNRPVSTNRHQPAAVCTSEDDGTRTRNHRIDSPVL